MEQQLSVEPLNYEHFVVSRCLPIGNRGLIIFVVVPGPGIGHGGELEHNNAIRRGSLKPLHHAVTVDMKNLPKNLRGEKAHQRAYRIEPETSNYWVEQEKMILYNITGNTAGQSHGFTPG